MTDRELEAEAEEYAQQEPGTIRVPLEYKRNLTDYEKMELEDRKIIAACKAAYLAGAASARRWIPVEERLPEVGNWVLIQGPRYKEPDKFWFFPCVARWNGAEFEPDTDNIEGDYEVSNHTDVTHWMPLPPAPEASGDA